MKTRKNASVTHRNVVSHKCALCSYSTGKIGNYKAHMMTHSNEKPFKCPECPYRAKLKDNIKSHVNNVHLLRSGSGLSRPFPCPHSGCSYAAKDKSVLRRHSLIHSDEKPEFSCSHPDCNFSTKYRKNLVLHVRSHTGEKPYICQFESCSFATAHPHHLVEHTRTHTKERPFKCPESNCEYSATRSSHLKYHQLTHPPKEGEGHPSFPCPLCEYKGKSKHSLWKHAKGHTLEKLFKCDEPDCSNETKRKSHLESLKLVHSDEKPFACSVESCEFRSKRQKNLLGHLKTHCEERRYKCELCPFRGKTRETVTSHLKNVHSDPDFQPFKCPEPKCKYTSKIKGNLNMHLLIHKGEKKYSCSFENCQYRAILEYMTKRHEMKFHGTEKPFKCGLCHFATKTNEHLVEHVRTHTKEAPFICKEEGCEYQAKQKRDLNRHKAIKHPQVCKQSK